MAYGDSCQECDAWDGAISPRIWIGDASTEAFCGAGGQQATEKNHGTSPMLLRLAVILSLKIIAIFVSHQGQAGPDARWAGLERE